ncbi:MAG: DUF1255 family protein [Candidatus Aminicenantes bacterium]|nr:DUF1255 family protein [Candidatus Aminicenantes bacterium]
MIRHNTYFDGRVMSLGPEMETDRFTVGVMEPGEFTFGTTSIEIMEVITGAMDVALPDGSRRMVGRHESFTVPAGVEFHVSISVPTAYLCSYR